MVMSPRIWPSPGVAISSARQDTGTWPRTSGAPRTRLRHRPNSYPFAHCGLGSEESDHAIGLPNIMPPGRSKLAVKMFTTSMSHDASVPNSWLHNPMRP